MRTFFGFGFFGLNHAALCRFVKGSCRDLFKELGILPLRSQHIYSLMIFVIKNREKFVTNKEYHELETRQDLNLHMHQVNLAIFSKGV
jgi:hypothetical protein